MRGTSGNVIGVSANNPHYFWYKGKEIILLTSAEHYGAVINKKFDYVKYFDTLAGYGLNYTRIYPGAFVERAGSWSPEDTLAPGEDLIVPWARSEITGYIGGGNKFDLGKWDAEYFARLRSFLAEAEKRDIIVEICFFNCQYPDQWPYSPLHKDSNIQGIGNCDYNTCQTLDDKVLLGEQLKYIEKIIEETNGFPNIIYEFIDEPTLFQVKSHKAYEWIDALVDKAVETEDRLPNKHILAQQLEYGIDFADDDRLSLIVTQYIATQSRQVGGIDGLNNVYWYGKPIEINETAYIPAWFDKDDDLVSISRLEAWEFMVGGGAGFNQLNGFFIPSNPEGVNNTNIQILSGLKMLRAFLESFDFAKMTRDTRIVQKTSLGAAIGGISERGRQYAIYMHHSFMGFGRFCGTYYRPSFGDYDTSLTIKIDKGAYKLAFIKPQTLEVLKEEEIASNGEALEIVCPRYSLDIAIKITAV